MITCFALPDPRKVDQCLFVDSLVTVSESGRELGEFCVSIQKASYHDESCYLVHANSHGTIDNIPCGTSVVAYISKSLETLEQNHHEYMKMQEHTLDKKVNIVRQEDHLVVNRVITEKEEVTKQTFSFPLHSLQGFVSEASNLLIMRILAWQRKVPEKMALMSFNADTQIGVSTYRELGTKKQMVGKEVVDVFGIERTISCGQDISETWHCYFLQDGSGVNPTASFLLWSVSTCLSMDLQLLHQIDEELTKGEVAALKFLCTDLVSKKRLEGVKDAKDLFLQLNEQALLDDRFLLAELLHTIGRYDLLRLLDTNKREMDSRLQNRTDSNSELLPYRIMLYKLSEDITDQNLRTIKFLLDHLPKAKLQSATFLDILTEMEKVQILGEDNLDELVKILDKCDKPLANKVREFKNQPTRNSDYNSKQNHSPAAVDTDAQGCPAIVDAQEEEKYYYPLTRRPRGYCLIINNQNFEKPLQERRGTHKDAEALNKIFTKLHFMVQKEQDCDSSNMLEVIKRYAEMDHSEMDAFVCCILSHGLKGTVLGTDGKEVPIRDLTTPFAYCKTLLSKPKLFFIQACQGDQMQRPIYFQADGEPDLSDEEYQEDAQSVALRSIPIQADFLIGMATVESYKSFRHILEGSIFIQELCRQLENGLQRGQYMLVVLTYSFSMITQHVTEHDPGKEDILSILTRVNREVSVQVLNGHKQMPEPRYTLTKKLVLTMD
ncbi:hypothetical protein NFI96_020334 [Prochilodus magdalenae]|nr:hypothetical protein NFI96_020334 [Prochilodus magdalenae]